MEVGRRRCGKKLTNDPERQFLWRLGEVLGCTADEAAARVTYGEFVEFCAWQAVKWKQREKIEFYLARIAAYLSGEKSARVSDHLLEFRAGRGMKDRPIKLEGDELVNTFKRAFGIYG